MDDKEFVTWQEADRFLRDEYRWWEKTHNVSKDRETRTEDFLVWQRARKDLESGENLDEAILVVHPDSMSDKALFNNLYEEYKREALFQQAEAERGQPTDIEVSGIGRLVKGGFGELCTAPLPVPLLGSGAYTFTLVDYLEDASKEDFHRAITNFMTLNRSTLKKARGEMFNYYKDCRRDAELPFIDSILSKVWLAPLILWHIEMGEEAYVRRCEDGNKGVYVSITCECSWEVEHGMELVFRDGLVLNKLGPFDGCLTNSDEDVIYESY